MPPGSWIHQIQQIYINSFSSIWEYKEAILGKKIDWESILGAVCPVCGAECGFREIAPYWRMAREIWPLREEFVPVSRFQCRGERRLRTFSMLPYQLAPYHQYTVGSMVRALLMWWEFRQDPEENGTAYQTEQALSGDVGVTAWQLRCWLLCFWHGLRAAQGELASQCDFSAVRFAHGKENRLDEVHCYFTAISRGPPVHWKAVVSAVSEYGSVTGRFLLGIPSQSR